MDPRLKLSRLHESDVAELLGGHRSKSSGNQWHDAADGKHGHYDDFAFAWDCKCVLPTTQSIRITRAELAKITTQAAGRRPLVPVRFYASERGQIAYDMALVRIHDLAELRERI